MRSFDELLSGDDAKVINVGLGVLLYQPSFFIEAFMLFLSNVA